MKKEINPRIESLNYAYFLSEDEKPEQCDAGIIDFIIVQRPTKTMVKKIGVEVSSRFMAMLSAAINLILKPYLKEGESFFLSAGEAVHNGYWMQEMIVELIYKHEGQNPELISWPILIIDLLERKYFKYRISPFNNDGPLSEGRGELEKKIIETIENLLKAIPWIDSSLSGWFLKENRL